MKIRIRLPLFSLTFFIIATFQILAEEKTNPPFTVTIEKTNNTPFGQMEDVRIYLDNSTNPGNPMGGFDFLIEYDASALSLNGVDPGQLITDCGWEYFTYRFGAAGNCGGNACPTGKVRIVAIAEINNGAYHPICFGETPAASSDLAVMHFLVTNNLTFECMFVPIRFEWYDCGDNAISSISGDSLFISNHVYEYLYGYELTNPNSSYPTYNGANWSCDTLLADSLPAISRYVNFYSGGVSIVCVDSIDDRGDINLNGLQFEVADLALFKNYFLYGIIVFNTNTAGQIAATDINEDGETLKLEDFVQLGMIITGNVPPDIDSTIIGDNRIIDDPNNGRILLNCENQVDIISLTILGNLTVAVSSFPTNVEYVFDGTYSRFLISDFYGMGPGIVVLLRYSGETEILEARGATRSGLEVPLTINDIGTGVGDEQYILPSDFALHQNYPNPFNNSTVISFDLPKVSDVEFEIINLLGQTVFRDEKHYSAGSHSIFWDSVDNNGKLVGSGVYYYRIIAGEFVESKKMILLK